MTARTYIKVTLICDHCGDDISESEDDDSFGSTYTEEHLYDRCTESSDSYTTGDGGYCCESCYDEYESDDSDEVTVESAQIKLNF